MRLLTLAEIQTLEAGETVPSFRAQIKEVKNRYTGTSQFGEWSIQQLVVMDSTGICQVKFKNHPEFTKNKTQQWFLVECIKSIKDGSLIGLKWKDDTYKEKTTRLIEATETATVTFDGAISTPEPKHELQDAPPDYESPVQTQPARPTLPDTAQAIQDVKERLGRAANGLILCYDAATYVKNQVELKHPGILLGPEQLEKIAVHLSITLEKNGTVHGLPPGPMPKKKEDQ